MENLETKRNIPRDLFLHLLAIVTLYWSSISFVTLVWQFINILFPDITDIFRQGGSLIGYSSGLIRFHVSAIIIVFPVFILISWYLNKIYKRESVVRESKIRKWLIYLTLFVASLVIIGDLIAIINMLLGGEITIRFILKALTIIAVAGIIFGYYLDDVRRETPTKLAKPFAIGSIILVCIVVVSAFFVVGSPASARLAEFDQQKVYDLQSVQDRIVNYYQSKEKLPEKLADLEDSISGFKVPVDQQAGRPYTYNVVYIECPTTNTANCPPKTLVFELCATFNKSSQQNNTTPKMMYPVKIGEVSQVWDHPAGDYCFSRTIDPERYPPFSKTK
jgi:hypothetical protein